MPIDSIIFDTGKEGVYIPGMAPSCMGGIRVVINSGKYFRNFIYRKKRGLVLAAYKKLTAIPLSDIPEKTIGQNKISFVIHVAVKNMVFKYSS